MHTAVIVAEPGAQCALSMACVLQCGQQRAVATPVATPVARRWHIHHPLLSPCYYM